MASWYADGGVSGFAIASNIPEEGLMDLTREVIKLATNGTVDANGVTRLQYDVPGANFRREISIIARLRLTQADFDARPSGFASSITATMFVADSGDFPAGYVPSPTEILALGDSKLSIFRGRLNSTPLVENTAPNPGDYVFTAGGFKPSAGRKYWVLVAPTYRGPGSTGLSNNPPVGNPNVTGRAVSMWANRRPLAPNITAPLGDVSVNAGQTFDLTYTTADPDAFPGAGSQQYTDIAGVQVQYAAKPTASNPSPTWIDLPIATYNTGSLGLGAGWYIDKSTLNEPVQDNISGGYYFWAAGSLTVKCGSNVLSPGQGVLPSGDWQVRMRTFDYGHPYPNSAAPLASSSRALNPASFPETNASPWSRAIVVSVAAQVPPPTPLAPRDNRAITVDQPITLSWQYRNTALPPFAQARRRVEIRKVGDPDWVVVQDTNSASTSYTVLSTSTPAGPTTREYLADGGFETSTDGWTATAAASSVLRVGGSVHSGAGALLTTGSGKYIRVAKDIPLPGEDTYVFKGWTAAGPNTLNHSFQWLWYNQAGTVIGGNETVFANQAEGVWTYHEVTFTKPVGAVSLKIVAGPYDLKASGAGTTSAGDRFDDFSLTGAVPPNSGSGFVFAATSQYEWRVRTVDASGVVSNYSPIARFWIVPTPASGIVRPAPVGTTQAATLGKGTHRAFIYRRGGKVRVGELTGLSHVDWERKRDDISTAQVVVSKWDIDCGNLLARLEPWEFELVLFRDNGYGTPKRVWEGPLMLPTYERDKVTINAKDVMVYPYRRIIKQLMNDSSQGDTVTSRAARILMNVLAPDDPNLLSYLTVISDPADPKQYRNIPAWSRTAFEEIDDMAANSGLDYTAVGRRIILWGTKNRIGTLPEFRDENLGSSPIVSVYGMSMANVYGVSDGAGVFGSATRLDANGKDERYGLVEMLSSSWASDSPEDAGTYTQAGIATTAASFAASSERSISHRYPPPVVVRIPDNTTLNPNTVLDIQQLVPGSVVPLRSTSTLRKVVADQKLDSVKVVEENGVEKIRIVLSPFSRDDSGTDEETTE